jgi:hypothetical protein
LAPPNGSRLLWFPDGSAVDLLVEATRWPCYRVDREGAKGQAGEPVGPPLDLKPWVEPSNDPELM